MITRRNFTVWRLVGSYKPPLWNFYTRQGRRRRAMWYSGRGSMWNWCHDFGETWRSLVNLVFLPDSCDMAVCQNLVPLVNIKIAGKWMFIPLKCIYRYWPIPIFPHVSGWTPETLTSYTNSSYASDANVHFQEKNRQVDFDQHFCGCGWTQTTSGSF